MGCSDSATLRRSSSVGASVKRSSSVILLDLMEQEPVSTTSTTYTTIPLTGEGEEDLAPYLEDIVVTLLAQEAVNLTYKVTVQQRTTGAVWSNPTTADVVGETSSTSLVVSSPFSTRQSFGRKFRLVLQIKATSAAHAGALMTISAALRLLP